jgi:hypothetical protein
MNRRSKMITGFGSLALVGATAVTGISTIGTASASGEHTKSHHHGRHLSAHLDPLNNSGARGHVHVTFKGKRAKVDIDAYGLTKGMPHAQHIHYGEEARHECPSVFDDTNNDHRLNVAEGLPAYGGIAKSLTTKGDTSPASGLAVDRFPTTPKGTEHYNRTISFKEKDVRRAVARGEGVVVIHGVDYNGNGKYDFDGAGKSELDASLPAEATDPALCGVLRVVKHHHHH